MTLDSLSNRLEEIESKLSIYSDRISALEKKKNEQKAVKRVLFFLQKEAQISFFFASAPSDYYNWTLSRRAEYLGCQVPQLTKSILLENTACVNQNCSDELNSRYYCVIVQYVSKLNTEKVLRLVRNLKPEEERPSRKKYNFQHAPAEVSGELTGFNYNGVSPFGMLTDIPVIVSHDILNIRPGYIWLGGGAELVKLRVSVKDLILSLNAVVGEVSTMREDLT